MNQNHFNFVNLLLLFFIALICSCSKDGEMVKTMEPPVPEIDSTYTFLALGDSYTIGQGVTPEESWPSQLKDELLAVDLIIDTLNVIATTGWTTQNLINNIASAQPRQHDLVSLLIGVNDQFQNRPFNDFTMGFDSLLQTAISLGGSKTNVMVVSIPDYGVTPFGAQNSESIAEELDVYNAYMQEECLMLDIPFINITEISRELGDGENALASDNLHPSAFQYGKWVEVILPVAIDILETD